MNYIAEMDRPNIIRPGQWVYFSDPLRLLGGRWCQIVSVDPILPGVVSQNLNGRRPVANLVVRLEDGEEWVGNDCDITGWPRGDGRMSIHDARICLPARKCATH